MRDALLQFPFDLGNELLAAAADVVPGSKTAWRLALR
jgi:hypothetical protein